jgi:glutaconate CoA-transferase, subunit B
MDYTPKEMMAIAAARTIRNDDIVFCGTGISMLAAMAAKHISAPESVIFFETGAIDSRLAELPLAVGDPRVMYRTAVNGNLLDSFATMQNRATGKRVVGILGAAQIDPYGNLNSTVIGDYAHPRVRFSGSGGAADVASFVDRTIIFMQHEKRKFVPRVDYLTSPGWLAGGDSRQEQGLCRGGPEMVITNLAVMGFDARDRRMFLHALYPGVTADEVVANTGFAIDATRCVPLAPPSAQELRVLRDVCDPERLILG